MIMTFGGLPPAITPPLMLLSLGVVSTCVLLIGSSLSLLSGAAVPEISRMFGEPDEPFAEIGLLFSLKAAT